MSEDEVIEPVAARVDVDADDNLDDLWLPECALRLERMSKSTFWGRAEQPDGTAYRFAVWAEKGRLRFRAEPE